MPRWTGGSRERLQAAALDLFDEDGYAATTTVAIAARAGVTERTLHRLFGDKREILFTDGDRIEQVLLDALPDDAAPGRALAVALRALALDMQPRREQLARRAAVIARNPELIERELLKLRSWSDALHRGLRDRGVDDFTAAVHAQIAVSVFRVAFVAWVSGRPGARLAAYIDRGLAAVVEGWCD